MSRYTGPQHRGAAREHRDERRHQAEARNQATPRIRRRWYRLGLAGPGLPHPKSRGRRRGASTRKDNH